MSSQSVVINGDLGSGKSTVAEAVSQRLGIKRLSIGDLHRQIARERGISALDLNLSAEVDEEIDNYIDDLQRKLAKADDPLVVDSRLAWFFFVDAFKVHLITDPEVAAQRVMSRPVSDVEKYESLSEARVALRRRSESERIRFIRKYHADKTRLRNYDVIVDTTRIDPGCTTEAVISAYNARREGPRIFLDPRRIYPSESVHELRGLWDVDAAFVAETAVSGPGGIEPLQVAYTGEYFYVIDGHRRLSAALQNDFKIIPCILAAEFDEIIIAERTAEQFFESELTLSKVYDWNAAHALELPLPPHLERQVHETVAEHDGH
jgi:CMP/dCMP kinase